MGEHPRARRSARATRSRVYTRKGDRGETRLASGERVRKDDARIRACGEVDELGACLALARQSLAEAQAGRPDAELSRLGALLCEVQKRLFDLGGSLGSRPAGGGPPRPPLSARLVGALERDLDRRSAVLPPLRSFVLAGGCRANAELHLARTVCRRAERTCVALAAVAPVAPVVLAYLNRLSDALFVWSRWASWRLGAEETALAPDGEPGCARSVSLRCSRAAPSRGSPRARSSPASAPRRR